MRSNRFLGPRLNAGVENREIVNGWKENLCRFEALSFTHKKGSRRVVGRAFFSEFDKAEA
jgi:hypothetical protein